MSEKIIIHQANAKQKAHFKICVKVMVYGPQLPLWPQLGCMIAFVDAETNRCVIPKNIALKTTPLQPTKSSL